MNRVKKNAQAKRVADKSDKFKRTFFNYRQENVGKALKAVRDGMAVATASKKFEVPRSTLRNKLSGRAPETSGRVGREAVLGNETEERLVQWLLQTSKMGFPINKDSLLHSVKKLLETERLPNPFKDNLPGRKWFEAFLRRHPQVSQKKAEHLCKAPAILTEGRIRLWFADIKDQLGERVGILQDPRRVFNMDEMAVYLSPNDGLMLGEKGESVYDVANDKENVTTLFTVNAAGEFAPPLTIYKYTRLPRACIESAPANWEIGRTENGWMTTESFYEYFTNVFHPFIVESDIPLPVVVFLDGHVSHLSLQLSVFCKENQIEICYFPSDATNILQPLDVAVFFPLKEKWKTLVRSWRIEHEGEDLQKHEVPLLLSRVINERDFTDTMKSGFKTCGLYPFDENAVNYTKCIQENKQQPGDNNEETERVGERPHLTHRDYVESKIDPELLGRFEKKRAFNETWDADDKNAALYEFWLKVIDDENEEGESVTLKQEEPENLEASDAISEASGLTVLEGNSVHNVLDIPFPEISSSHMHSTRCLQTMVRRYVRKTTRGCWDERAMVSAMDAIQSKKMGYLQSAKKHGVPRSTLRRIMKKLAADGEVNIRSPLGSKASIFTASEEKQLAAHLLTIEKSLFIITNVARRKLAYQLATKIGKANKWKDNIAGREWLRDFMRRNEEVAVKPSPPGKPAAPKVVGFNKPAVTKFYEVLGDLYNKHQLTSDRIYNCDEVSITCDAKSQGKTISLKGHTPGAPGSAPVEPGKTITVELCMSATGVFMPLLFVFPRSSLDPQFTSHLILPCYTRCHESGWMMSDSFFCWLNHFVKFSRATPNNPVLLLMDGDTSHTMTIPLLELARDNGVIMLCLPQNCTHKLQPLEAEFFGPLSKHYATAVANWIATHPGQPVTIYQIPMLFEQAFIQSATMVTALIAFRKTGIWPFNPHNFTEQDFAGSASNLLPQQNAPAIEPAQNSVVNNNKEPVPLAHTWKGNNCAEEMRATTSTSFVEAVLGEPQNHASRKRPNQYAVPVIQQSCSQNNSKEPTIPNPPWKSMVNCVNDMRASSALEAALEHQNNQQRKRTQHAIASSSLPAAGHLNYQINNMEPAMPGPHWKSANSVNEMRLSTSSAYVEAVFGGPQNHPSRNMEEPQVPGPSSEPSIYNMIPHMFM